MQAMQYQYKAEAELPIRTPLKNSNQNRKSGEWKENDAATRSHQSFYRAGGSLPKLLVTGCF